MYNMHSLRYQLVNSCTFMCKHVSVRREQKTFNEKQTEREGKGNETQAEKTKDKNK